MKKANLPAPGATVSHYRVLNPIAGGGMGVVFRAEDIKLGRAVALKFLPEEAGDDEIALARFEREARTASSLSHANICTIYEVEEHEGTPFIVMEYLEGTTLRDLIAQASIASPLEKTRKPPTSVEDIVDIGMQIADGLDSAHRKGIIHRDIKPANIFVTRDRQVKILDFGLAKLIATAHESASDHITGKLKLPLSQVARTERPMDPDLTRVGAALGTTGYMSPEQVQDFKLDARTDIFCLGLVLYELATGRRAFGGATKESYREALLHEAVIPVRELNPAIPAPLEAIIHRCLEKDRKLRYQEAAEVRKDLKPIRRELSALAISKSLVAERIAEAAKKPPQGAREALTAKRAAPQPANRRKIAMVIAAIVIAVAIGLVYILSLRSPHG
jgi:serine/threonine protein kinase